MATQPTVRDAVLHSAPACSRTGLSDWLHGFACAVAACTFLLILAGSTVTTTGSGLAVPDWPTSYGYNMFAFPLSKMVGGIWYEHGHRLVASVVGMLTIVLCVWLWRSRQTRRLKWLGTLALLAVCVQGLLGGLTVRWLLPAPVSIAHAGLAQIFFCLTISIAVMTSPSWAAAAPRPAGVAMRRWSGVLLVCVFLQILLGAWMRHTESGLAVPDFPLMYGSMAPPVPSDIAEINHHRLWMEPRLPPVTIGQVWVHLAHRLGAVVVAVVVIAVTRRVLRDHGGRPGLVWPAVALCGLIITQAVLGGMTIWTRRALDVTTAHVGAGALMLACALLLAFAAHRRPHTSAGASGDTSRPHAAA